MPKGIPKRSGSYLADDIYAIRRFAPGQIGEMTEYCFLRIGRVYAGGYARYNQALFRWHNAAELPALVETLRKEDPELYGYDVNEQRDFIKLWEPCGSYKRFW